MISGNILHQNREKNILSSSHFVFIGIKTIFLCRPERDEYLSLCENKFVEKIIEIDLEKFEIQM